MKEDDKKNLADFKEAYINLVLDTKKEFVAMLVPVALTDKDIKQFSDNSPETIDDPFMSTYSELIKKHKIMFIPQIIQTQLDDRSKKVYEGEIDVNPFSTTT